MLLSILFSTLFASAVHAEQFQAPVTDTQWHVTESPLECSLMQPIPDFGEAGFYRRNGGPLSLSFKTFSQPSTQSLISFEIAEAPWQNSDEHQPLQSVSAEKGQKEFVITGLAAEQALTQLQNGQFPVIRYHSMTGMKEISVMLSTVHLSDSLPAFQQCLGDLYPDTFAEVQFLTIYFDLEKSELTAVAKKALDRLAGYIKIDQTIKEIYISSHTDTHGRRSLNEPLSEARANCIKDYLVKEHGIDEGLFRIKSFVETKPAATNKTQIGRAYNRRAEIKLTR